LSLGAEALAKAAGPALWSMLLLQQNPIVVETVRQPAATPEISYVGVLGTAALMVVVILAVAVAVGAVVGGLIIWRKKQREKMVDTSQPSHVRLKLS
jgi:hypothetical protein